MHHYPRQAGAPTGASINVILRALRELVAAADVRRATLVRGCCGERGGLRELGRVVHHVEHDVAERLHFGLSAPPCHVARVAALEDDRHLEAAEHEVVVDLVDRAAGVRWRSTRAARRAVGHARRSRCTPSSERSSSAFAHGIRTQPRSSSGSPIVAISQSTIAASLAGRAVAEHHVGELVVAVHDARARPTACSCGATRRRRRCRAGRGPCTSPDATASGRPGARGSPPACRSLRGRRAFQSTFAILAVPSTSS